GAHGLDRPRCFQAHTGLPLGESPCPMTQACPATALHRIRLQQACAVLLSTSRMLARRFCELRHKGRGSRTEGPCRSQDAGASIKNVFVANFHLRPFVVCSLYDKWSIMRE